MSPLALAPAVFSGGGKLEAPPIDTSQKDNVRAIRNEIQQIHQSQDAPHKKGLSDFNPNPSAPPTQQSSPVQDFKSSDVQDFEASDAQYASLADAIPLHQGPKRSEQDELLHKLDKILFLLEEQRDQKTGHVAEEVVLYSFIGIFIIFVLDSFARAGKYVR